MSAVVAMFLFMAIVSAIRAINKATTGDEKGCYLGETVLGAGCGIVVVLGAITASIVCFSLAAPLLLMCTLVVAAFAVIRKYLGR